MDNAQKEMRNSIEKIRIYINEAKERVKKRADDDISAGFIKLQIHTIKLMDILKKVGCEKHHDWVKMMENVCVQMTPLKPVQPFTISVEGFAMRAAELVEKQKVLKGVSKIMARKLLSEGKHMQAVEAALYSLRFSIEVHGLNSVALVPAYLILCEANIGLGNLEQADEYLAHAEWTVMKSTDCTNGMKSKLFRKMGILFATKGDYDNAQRMFAEDVYHGSLEWGTDHVQTTGGFFHMANVFFRLNQMDIADSLYNQVINNWFKFLVEAVNTKIRLKTHVNPLKKNAVVKVDGRQFFDEDLEAEGHTTMWSVYEIRELSPKQNHEELATITFDLCMFFYLTSDYKKSMEFYKKGKLIAAKVKEAGGYTKEIPKLFSEVDDKQSPPPTGDNV